MNAKKQHRCGRLPPSKRLDLGRVGETSLKTLRRPNSVDQSVNLTIRLKISDSPYERTDSFDGDPETSKSGHRIKTVRLTILV